MLSHTKSNQTAYNKCVFEIKYQWNHLETSAASKDFKCGHCGHPVASEKGYTAAKRGTAGLYMRIYICHFCTRPTFFDQEGNKQWPGAAYGNEVQNIDDDLVAKLYKEARDCTSTNSYTASVMCCRKLLMHIAVSKGAKQNLKFVEYVDYLASNNYITPDSKPWVDHIKNKGNEANHEIKLMTKEDAEELISFSEMLLKLIYEFPARIKPPEAPAQNTAT